MSNEDKMNSTNPENEINILEIYEAYFRFKAKNIIRFYRMLYSKKCASLHNGLTFKQFKSKLGADQGDSFYDVLGKKLGFYAEFARQDAVHDMLRKGIPKKRLKEFIQLFREALIEYSNSLSDYSNEGREIKLYRIIVEEMVLPTSYLLVDLLIALSGIINYCEFANDKYFKEALKEEKLLEHQLSSTSTEETKELHIKVLKKTIQLKAKDKEERAKKAIQRKAKEKEERVIREYTE